MTSALPFQQSVNLCKICFIVFCTSVIYVKSFLSNRVGYRDLDAPKEDY